MRVVGLRQTDLCQRMKQIARKTKKNAFLLGSCPVFYQRSIGYYHHHHHWILFLFTSAVGVQSVCTQHVTQPPVSLPLPPEALISCWESVELDKGHGSGPLGAQIRACYGTTQPV